MTLLDSDAPLGVVDKFNLIGRALADPTLSKADASVLYAICGRYNAKHGCCWPGLGTIARDAGVCRRTAVRSIARLAAEKYISVVSGRGSMTSNTYTLNRDKAVTKGSDTAVTTLGTRLSPEHIKEHIKKNKLKGTQLSNSARSASLTFDEWMQCEAALTGAVEAAENYLVTTGLPAAFAQLTLACLRATYVNKARDDWSGFFQRAVRNCWGGLWRFTAKGVRLTTAGEQLKRQYNIHGLDMYCATTPGHEKIIPVGKYT